MGDLTDLVKKYLKIYNSSRNIENKKYYKKTRSIIINRTRYVPKNLDRIDNNIPFMYWLDDGLWRYILNTNLERLYKEPLYYLEIWLKKRIFYYENFIDCNYFDSFIPIWLGLGFETTFFGCNMEYSPSEEPSIGFQDILIKDHKDLEKLKTPDFYNNDSMKLVFKFYNEINDFVSDYGIEVGFFDWNLSPLNLCNYLRGMGNISMDVITNKEFVKNFMEFLLKSRIEWSKKRGRIGDGETIEDFEQKQAKEMYGDGPAQHIGKCMELADYTIINDSSKENLYKKVEEVLEKCSSATGQ